MHENKNTNCVYWCYSVSRSLILSETSAIELPILVVHSLVVFRILSKTVALPSVIPVTSSAECSYSRPLVLNHFFAVTTQHLHLHTLSLCGMAVSRSMVQRVILVVLLWSLGFQNKQMSEFARGEISCCYFYVVSLWARFWLFITETIVSESYAGSSFFFQNIPQSINDCKLFFQLTKVLRLAKCWAVAIGSFGPLKAAVGWLLFSFRDLVSSCASFFCCFLCLHMYFFSTSEMFTWGKEMFCALRDGRRKVEAGIIKQMM